jgi:hypothetical protein
MKSARVIEIARWICANAHLRQAPADQFPEHVRLLAVDRQCVRRMLHVQLSAFFDGVKSVTGRSQWASQTLTVWRRSFFTLAFTRQSV